MTRTVFLLAALLAASPAAAYYWRYNPYGFDNRYRGFTGQCSRWPPEACSRRYYELPHYRAHRSCHNCD
jgi:hypothetical protein